MQPIGKLKHLLLSFGFSTVVVGALVGNAYMACNVGYPGFLEYVGLAIVFVSFIVAIPPGIILSGLDLIGLTWHLRGRESFIQSNPWLWVYCAAFYTIAIYVVLRLRQRRIQRKTEL